MRNSVRCRLAFPVQRNVVFLCLVTALGKFDLLYPLDHRIICGFCLLMAVTSGLVALRDFSTRGGAGALVHLALWCWHFGFQTPKWCVATQVKRSISAQHMPGLTLVDDVLRAVFRFVSNTPADVCPVALTNQRNYYVWIHDELWWETCYKTAEWMKIPVNPKHDPPRRLVNEAAMWVSMTAETLGMMVMLPPRCAASFWVVAPCFASTLLVLCCSPWLPQQSDVVLVAMVQLLRFMSRYVTYFSVIWIVITGLLVPPEELSMCTLPDHSALSVVELGACVTLVAMVAGHLWRVTAFCRVSSPLYAVPANDTDTRQRPLYCSVGLVEGSHAPTRMCNLEDRALCESRWQDRYTIRRCTESLTAQEAHQLSSLDALNARIAEVERSHRKIRRGSFMAAPQTFTAVTVLLSVCAVGVSTLVVQSWRSCHGRRVLTNFSVSEAMLWTSLLVRVGHCCHSIVARVVVAWDSPRCSDLAALRRKASALHKKLAKTQWMLCHLETQLESLGIEVQRCHRARVGQSLGATRVLLLAWLSSVAALAILPYVK